MQKVPNIRWNSKSTMKLKDFNKIISKVKGIYFLFDNNKECVYIGKSNNIRVRLRNELNPKICWFAKEIKYFEVFPTHDIELEKVFIKIFNPKININHKVKI